MKLFYTKTIPWTKITTIFILFAMIASLTLFLVSTASAQSGYKITTSLPGTNIVKGDPVKGKYTLQTYIKTIYIFALSIVGLVALAMITYHSVRYILAAGNAGKMSDATGGIWDAVLGLALLLMAATILAFINPSLVNLRSFDEYIPAIPDAPFGLPNTSIGTGQGGLCFGQVGSQADCRAGLICASNDAQCAGGRPTCLPAEPSCKTKPPPPPLPNTVGAVCTNTGCQAGVGLTCATINTSGVKKCIPQNQVGLSGSCAPGGNDCYTADGLTCKPDATSSKGGRCL